MCCDMHDMLLLIPTCAAAQAKGKPVGYGLADQFTCKILSTRWGDAAHHEQLHAAVAAATTLCATKEDAAAFASILATSANNGQVWRMEDIVAHFPDRFRAPLTTLMERLPYAAIRSDHPHPHHTFFFHRGWCACVSTECWFPGTG